MKNLTNDKWFYIFLVLTTISVIASIISGTHVKLPLFDSLVILFSLLMMFFLGANTMYEKIVRVNENKVVAHEKDREVQN